MYASFLLTGILSAPVIVREREALYTDKRNIGSLADFQCGNV